MGTKRDPKREEFDSWLPIFTLIALKYDRDANAKPVLLQKEGNYRKENNAEQVWRRSKKQSSEPKLF